MVDSGTYTPEVIARRIKLAEELLAPRKEPIRHWAQGLDEVAKGALGGYQLNQAEKMSADARRDAIAQALAVFGGGENAPAMPPQQMAALPPQGTPTLGPAPAGPLPPPPPMPGTPNARVADAFGDLPGGGPPMPAPMRTASLSPEPPKIPVGPNSPVVNLTDPRVTPLGESVEPLPPAPTPRPAGVGPVAAALNVPAAGGGMAGGGGAPNNRAAIAAMFNPWTPPMMQAMLARQLEGNKVTYQTDGDGNILAMDPHGRFPPKVVYKAAVKPIVVKEDDRLYDTGTRSYIGGAAPAPTSVPGPDGKPIAIPPGLSSKDAREFSKRVTESSADAAAGKKTEVQAKDEKFANKMELSEKNIIGLEGEGTGFWNNLFAHPYAAGGNYLQTEKFQKYNQAKNNFITALLRDESGAAIGTAEFIRYEKEMFPQPGDSAGVIEQKKEARRVAIDAMKKGAGPGYKSPTTAPPVGEAPGGVDPKVWAAMTPEERALWQK